MVSPKDLKAYVEMASPVPTLKSVNQTDKINELQALGIQVEEQSTGGWRFTMKEKMVAVTPGDIMAKRFTMESLAGQVFPNADLHFTVQGGVRSIIYVMGIGNTQSAAITATMR